MTITISDHGTMFSGEDGTALYQAIALRSALKLHKVGIKINRHTRDRDLFLIASQFTGKTYKARQYDAAIADLAALIEQAKANLMRLDAELK